MHLLSDKTAILPVMPQSCAEEAACFLQIEWDAVKYTLSKNRLQMA